MDVGEHGGGILLIVHDVERGDQIVGLGLFELGDVLDEERHVGKALFLSQHVGRRDRVFAQVVSGK